MILSPYLPSQYSGALEGLSRFLSMDCSQCLHLVTFLLYPTLLSSSFSVFDFEVWRLVGEDSLSMLGTHDCISTTWELSGFSISEMICDTFSLQIEKQSYKEHFQNTAPLWYSHRFSSWLFYAPETPPSTHLSPESKPDSCALSLQ